MTTTSDPDAAAGGTRWEARVDIASPEVAMNFTVPAALAVALLLSPATGTEPTPPMSVPEEPGVEPGYGPPALLTAARRFELDEALDGAPAPRSGHLSYLLVNAPAAGEGSGREGYDEVATGGDGRNPWTIVGNAGWGAPVGWDQQIHGPAFSAQFLRREGARFELGFEVAAFLGRPDERHDVSEHRFGRTESLTVRKEQHWGVLSRVNYLLGEEGVRPYISGGIGAIWLRRRSDTSWRTVAPDGSVRESSRSHDSGGPALANLLAAGVEVPLGDRLRLRPEVGVLTSFPGFMLKPQVTASIVWPLGADPTPMPPPDRRPRTRDTKTPPSPAAATSEEDPAAAPPQVEATEATDTPGKDAPEHDPADEEPATAPAWSSLREAARVVARAAADRPSPPPDDAWGTVMELRPGRLVEVELFPAFHAFNPDGALQRPEGGDLFGTVVEVNPDGIRVAVDEGKQRGRWFVSRDAVRRISTGVIGRDPPWEGIGAGFAAGLGAGAVMYAAYAAEGISPRVIPYAGLVFGGPLAVLGGVLDYRKSSFQRTSTVYVGQR